MYERWFRVIYELAFRRISRFLPPPPPPPPPLLYSSSSSYSPFRISGHHWVWDVPFFLGGGGAVAPFVSLSNRLRFPNRALVIGRRKSTVPNGLPRNYAALFYHHLGWLCPREGDHLGSDLFPFIRLFVRFQWVFCGHSAMVAANYKTTHFFTGFSVIQVKARKLLFYIIGGNLIKLAKFTVSIITLFRVFSFRQCKHFLSHGILLLHYSLQCQV